MWKHLGLLGLILLISSLASATTVTEERVDIDLQESRVHVELHVEELTSTHLTYFTTYSVDDVTVMADGEELNCEVGSTSIESEISCDINKTEDFDAKFNFSADDLVSDENNRKVFEYTQDFIRPTQNYTLSVTLPQGDILVDEANVTRPVLSPSNADISTNGQRIKITWNKKPDLGETTTFRLLYEPAQEQENGDNLGLAIAVIILLSIGAAAVLGARQYLKKSVEDEYSELSEDEIDLIELLRENEGSMLQKDIVQSMDYSKAKVSGIVKDLVEKEILEKEKEGRSNQLSISKKYRY